MSGTREEWEEEQEEVTRRMSMSGFSLCAICKASSPVLWWTGQVQVIGFAVFSVLTLEAALAYSSG